MDIFKLRDHSLEHELQGVVMISMSKRGILTAVEELNVENLTRFLALISRGYKNISYHNKTHGSDVCQTFNFFLQGDGLIKKCKMTHEESMAYLIAAVCHDYEHPGVNNVFLTQIRDKVAVRHNDVSVLENHHIAATFDLITSSNELNWLSGFSIK